MVQLMQYGILRSNGEVITDAQWLCEADVIQPMHSFGVKRAPGTLVVLTEEGWKPVREESERK